MAKDLPPFYSDAAGPLPLLSTPAFETGKNDNITLGASHMALSHNAIIRGYNSIYQVASRVFPSDHGDFIGYCLAWHRFVEEHHKHEEMWYFPAIEKEVGEEGVMVVDVEEHATFHEGLEKFKSFLTNITSPDTDFKPTRLLEIMDSFSTPLHAHLVSEPQHILALARFGKDINLVKIEQNLGKKNMTLEFVLNVLPVFLGNMEGVEFEGGMWKDHPKMPGVVRWLLKRVIPMWNARWWKFLSCDGEGKRRRLAA